MVVDRTLLAVVGVEYLFIEESAVAALGDVFIYRREKPQSVVGAVAGVSGLLDVFGVVRGVFLTGLVGVLHQRQTRAVRHLRGKHKYYLLLCHFGGKVDNALDILYGVAVAEAVAESAVLEGRGSRPCEGDEAVVGVPNVDDIVEVLVRGMHLQIIELAVPVFFQDFKLLIADAGLFVAGDYLLRFLLRLLTEKVNEFLRLAGSEGYIRLESAAGVGVEVQVAVKVSRRSHRVRVAVVAAHELVAVAAVFVHLLESQTEETVVVGVPEYFVLLLEDILALEVGMGDEKGVLEVHLILLVVVVVDEFAVACNGEPAGL